VKSEIKTPEAVNIRLASKSSSMNTGITFEKIDVNLPQEYQPRQSFNLKLDTENPYCFFRIVKLEITSGLRRLCRENVTIFNHVGKFPWDEKYFRNVYSKTLF
jgi:hypothetical protein